MEKKFTILVAVLSLSLFLGAGSDDVLKNLSTFEQSLSQWMRSIEGLNTRIAEIERSMQGYRAGGPEMAKSLTDVTSNLEALRTELSSSSMRLKKLEETLGGAENPMAVFGNTLNTLRKSVADLSKKVEDQAVVTSVLEKRYQEFTRPLEPLKKAIEEEREVGKALTALVEEQKKKIEARETEVIERLAALESVLDVKGQSSAVSEILRRVESLEKHTGAPPLPELVKAEESKPEAVVQEEVKPKTPEEEGFTGIGAGFYTRDVKFMSFGSSAKVTGEIKNLSDSDYGVAVFNIKVYDLSNAMVSTQDFSIKRFKNQTVKSFKELVTGTDPEKISKYVISFKGSY